MTFKILYSGLVTKSIIRNSLIYLYPEQSYKISNIVRDLNINNVIYILNDDVKEEYYYNNNVYSIYDKNFVKIINILNECNDINIILVEDENDYLALVESDNRFELRGNFHEKYFYIKTKENICNITTSMKNMFFSKFKFITAKSYMRNLKFKQLL